jgi:uncharacterized membrane protein (UPF0182 family)
MRIRLSLLALLFVFFILAPTLARWYTDWLWFGEVGYRRVFWVPLLSRIGVTVVASGVLFALFIVNLRPLLRRPPLDDVIDLEPRSRGSREFRRVFRRQQMGGVVTAALALVAFLSGLAASTRWPMFQQFVHARPFGVTDPIFGRDIGFFMFRLPVYQYVESWLFGWLVLIFLVVAAAYYLSYAPMMLRGVWSLPSPVRAHLSLLAGAIVLVRGWGFWLDAFALEYSRRGAIVGAGYTDVYAVLPVLRLLTLLFVICGILLFINIRRRTWRPALATIVVILVAWLVGLGVIPRFVQQVRVSPNELTVETPYIRHGITSTLRAFGLDRIREHEFSAEPISAEIVSRNRPTVDNVRLWDYRPLLSAYQQLQALRQYYLFRDVDIDRYPIGGVQRQVMLSARELEVGRLAPQARTWVNEHLVFTHGYGLVMSPVNRVSEEGMPEFFLRNIPPVGEAGLQVTRPQIYFGEQTGRHVIVNTRVQELDYPRGDENVYASYAGRGGIQLTPLRRMAFAYRFGDLRLLISSDITRNSRLMFARDITTRVRRLAPFLSYDRDPYVVLVDGELKWVIDAYTTSNRYPYATPVAISPDGPAPETEINYIRNSIKVVIDAYDGAVDFYVVDATDPLAQSFTSIFPELFKPASQMPRGLASHLRYPVDLFEIQARMYATFHMRDPRVFYNREDVWSVPTELFGNETVVVEPYYVTMRLGSDPQPEFILILPFSPSGRDNMIAWMAARNDAPGYGELVVYRFPKDRLAFGPMQVESRINQDPVISQQLTLWNQEGSRVIRGNMLVIPMENALMYVEPLFLQAERSQLPELKRVIVASGPRIVMDETLDGAIARLLGRLPPSPTLPPAGGTPAPAPSTAAGLIRRAVETYERAQQLLSKGDFSGYAREIERLGPILRELEKTQ